MLQRFSAFPECASLTLTIQGEANLTQALEVLARARSRFMSIMRFSRTVDGWARSTELTKAHALWHPHDHFLIFDRSADQDAMLRRALDAWAQAARDVGAVAHPLASSGRLSDTDAAVRYAFKGMLGSGPNSLRTMLEAASQGDADAADDWIELERLRHAHRTLRWRGSWTRGESSPSTRKTPYLVATATADLARLVLLDFLNVRSKRHQADVLGIGTATVGRRRRLLPAGRRDGVDIT